MFIVDGINKNPSPVGAECQHCAPSGAWCLIGNSYYKHCAPTELTSQNRALDSLDSPASLDCYSYLKATIGSTFVARRAGTKQAARATPARISEISVKVSGSVALMPNNRL